MALVAWPLQYYPTAVCWPHPSASPLLLSAPPPLSICFQAALCAQPGADASSVRAPAGRGEQRSPGSGSVPLCGRTHSLGMTAGSPVSLKGRYLVSPWASSYTTRTSLTSAGGGARGLGIGWAEWRGRWQAEGWADAGQNGGAGGRAEGWAEGRLQSWPHPWACRTARHSLRGRRRRRSGFGSGRKACTHAGSLRACLHCTHAALHSWATLWRAHCVPSIARFRLGPLPCPGLTVCVLLACDALLGSAARHAWGAACGGQAPTMAE